MQAYHYELVHIGVYACVPLCTRAYRCVPVVYAFEPICTHAFLCGRVRSVTYVSNRFVRVLTVVYACVMSRTANYVFLSAC